MIKAERFFTAYCDGCQSVYEDDDRGICIPEKSDMQEIIVSNGWVMKGRKCFCPECQEAGLHE